MRVEMFTWKQQKKTKLHQTERIIKIAVCEMKVMKIKQNKTSLL